MIQLIQNRIGSSPNANEINSVLALHAEGRYKESAILTREMTVRFPVCVFGWTALGIAFLQMGRSADALDPLKKASELSPDNPDVPANMGVALRNLGRLDEAEAMCRRALQLKPDHADASCNLGMTLHELGRFDEAEQSYRKAVLLDAKFRFNLANFLAASNRSENVEEAKSIFLEIIRSEPTNFGAWNNLGFLLFETGYTSAAHTAYSAAVTYHPHEASAHVNLGSVLLDMGDLSAAEQQFKIALDLNPDLSNAHQGLASIFQRQGNEAESGYHRNMGFGKQPISTSAYRGRGKPVQLLVLHSALEGNIPWQFLVDRNIFQTTAIAVEYIDSRLPLPLHHLIINAIGDADICQNGLEIAAQLIKKSQASVINCPTSVLQTGRLINARRLGSLSGVIAPRMALVQKMDMISGHALEIFEGNEFTFPLLLRPPGFHNGSYFVRVDSPDELNSASEGLPSENILVIEFIDSRLEDGLFRKYRVMSINGTLYPIHMAISTQWKVHYFSSDMEDNEKYRHEEEIFLNDFYAFLGAKAISALDKISQTLALDYCGIDFGMDKNGNVLLYEANSTMVIAPPANDRRWDYKRVSIANALAAAKAMFAERTAINGQQKYL